MKGDLTDDKDMRMLFYTLNIIQTSQCYLSITARGIFLVIYTASVFCLDSEVINQAKILMNQGILKQSSLNNTQLSLKVH